MLASLLCAGALMACGTSAAPTVNRFDGDRAWKPLEYQVKLGPRPAGSGSRGAAAYIKAQLPDSHIEPVPGGLQNVVGRDRRQGQADRPRRALRHQGPAGFRRCQRRCGRHRRDARDRPRR